MPTMILESSQYLSFSLYSTGKLILQQHERGGDPLRVGKESTVGVSQWMKLGLPLILIPYAAIFHAKGNSLWLNAQSTHFIRFMGRWDVCERGGCSSSGCWPLLLKVLMRRKSLFSFFPFV